MTIPLKIINKKDMKKILKQTKVWDSISVPWEKYVVKELPIVVEFLKDKKGKIVDLGCGSGRNMIPNKDIEYYAVDFSCKQIENSEKYAKNNNVNAKFFESKVDKLPMFENEIFDSGLFIATLHCLETAKERKDALKEFYRILKKRGQGIISVWSNKDFTFKGYGKEVFMSWRKESLDIMRYYYLYDKKELIDLLKSVGFEILKIYEPSLHDRFSKKNLIIRVGK